MPHNSIAGCSLRARGLKTCDFFVQRKPRLLAAGLIALVPLGFAVSYGFGWLYPTVAGAMLAYLTVGVVTHIDLARGTVRYGWYFLFVVPLRTQQAQLAQRTSVQLSKEIVRSRGRKKRAIFLYPVRLKGIADHAVKIFVEDIVRARVFAERLARLLQLPLHDSSHGRKSIRGPEELDMALGERLLHRGERPELPAEGPGRYIKVRPEGRGMRLKMPGQPLPLWVLALLCGASALFGVVAWLNAAGVERVVYLSVIVAVGMYLAYAYAFMAAPLVLWVGPEEVAYRKLFSRKRMKMADLEDLISVRLDLYLVSDQQVMGLPYDFTDKQEATYVKQLIQHMAAQAKTGAEQKSR